MLMSFLVSRNAVVSRIFAVTLTTGLAGCAASTEDAPGSAESALESAMTNTELAGGVTKTVVNASNSSTAIYIDLGWKTEVFPKAPGESADWDLSFQREKIKANGGPGEVRIATLAGANFDTLRTAPATGYTSDGAQIAEWYVYDHATHVLTPANSVFVIQSIAGDYFKLKFDSYYSAAGTSGYPTFRWAPIDPPASVE